MVNSRTAYRHAHKMGWMDDICGHMAMRNHWDFEALLKEARKHKPQRIFVKRADLRMTKFVVMKSGRPCVLPLKQKSAMG